MNANFIVVKSMDPPEAVTDALELVADEAFTAEHYRTLAGALCARPRWSGELGSADLDGIPVSLEATDAGLLLSLPASAFSPTVRTALISGAHRAGSVVMSADTAEILTEQDVL